MSTNHEKCADTVVEAVRADLLNRSKVGIEKYGVTLGNSKLSHREYLQHAYEETLDKANYLKGAIMVLDAEAAEDAIADFEPAARAKALTEAAFAQPGGPSHHRDVLTALLTTALSRAFRLGRNS